MNAKTLHKLMLPVPFVFVLSASSIFAPEHGAWSDFAAIGVLLAFVYGLFGGILGLMFVFRQLHLGCPICRDRARVVSGGKRHAILLCPKCGEVLTTTKWVFEFHYERLEDDHC